MARYQETDRVLRRIERDSLVIGAAAVLGALIVERGQLGLALGVMAGAGMMAVGYAAVRSAVDASLGRAASSVDGDAATPATRRRAITRAIVRLVTRYAMVAAVAVVALGLLGAHPLGLFVGVSIPVAAIAIEAVRLVRRPRE